MSADGRLLASGSFDGTVRLREATSGVYVRTLQTDRRYERLDITGLTGVTSAQRAALLALGAVDQEDPAGETTSGMSPRSPFVGIVSQVGVSPGLAPSNSRS